jgi:hypothetical protein
VALTGICAILPVNANLMHHSLHLRFIPHEFVGQHESQSSFDVHYLAVREK